MKNVEQQVKALIPKEWQEAFLNTQKDIVEFSFMTDGELPLTTSKAGGVGYIPKSMTFPVNPDGMPLSLLAQINFAEMPALDPYPPHGLLAFYVDYYDDLIGADFDDYDNKNGYRVFYFESFHEESYSREEQAAMHEPYEDEEKYPIVDTELAMIPSLSKQILMTDSVEFERAFQTGKYDFKGFDTYDDKYEPLMGFGTQLGGYPSFTQTDPREYLEDGKEKDILLFQLDSCFGRGQDWEIMWGDAGIGNFFISPEDLKAKNFEKVWYNWDCS
ncbi:YwqG family protein [Domibacillus robiginosus]|uniref:YwqG family protein n=1 Tax=Domibacillus robiginosus TaxID=1071054 RepID=UPI00067ABCEE|nr:YwqG family protein [Domibacillus robiginosus]